MSYWKTSLGIWGMMVLLAVALMIPRYESRRNESRAAADSNARQLVGLDYARERLWTDFLLVRGTGLPGHRLPSPTLDEYRRYLSAIGLSEPGDVVTLYVVPPRATALGLDQIHVALDLERASVALRVATKEAGRPMPAGALHIRPVANDSLICEVAPAAEVQLWSFWPVTAQPLFP